MDYITLFSKLPFPLIIINAKDGTAMLNIASMEIFGNDIKSITQLESFFVDNKQFNLKSEYKIHEERTIITKNGDIKEITLISNKIDDLTYAFAICEPALNFDFIFTNPFIHSLLSGIPRPSAIIAINYTKGKVLFASPYILEITGYSPNELISEAILGLNYDDNFVLKSNQLSISDSSNIKFMLQERKIVTVKNRSVWFDEYTGFFDFNTTRYQLIILSDITQQKENEVELNRAIHLVEDAEKLKSSFLDNMPHEIRTPLHAITGFTSLLSDPNLDQEEREEYVKIIQDSSNDILKLIDNIIEISKLETNQIRLKQEKCFINSILDRVYCDTIELQRTFEKQNLKISYYKEVKNPEYFIFSDSERIYQILMHLINNALKFTEEGSIIFGYHINNDLNQIEFYVNDTGIGIPNDQIDIIFKKFGKSGNVNTDKNRGTGLGLTLSKKLIELLEGEIIVNSEVSVGSRFTFIIPTHKKQRISITKPLVVGEINWSSKTMLLAEDTDSNFYFIEAFLEKTHINILWAHNGLEAIDIVKTNSNIDIILMDIMMPLMDGYEATVEIKKLNPDIPIIAQTALALPEDEDKCYECGCDYVLVKPINSQDLIATIRRFV